MKPVKATTFILVFSLAVWLIYQAASEQDNKDLKVELSAPPTLIKDSNAVDFIVKEEAPKLSLEEPMIDFDFSNPLSYASGSSHSNCANVI